MGSEGFLVVGIGLGVGIGIIKFLSSTKFGKKYILSDRKRDAVLRDPDLLVEKLKEGRSQMVDDGGGMEYSVVEEDGKKKVKLDMINNIAEKSKSNKKPHKGSKSKKKVSKGKHGK